MVDVAFDPGGPFDPGGDIGLAAQPGRDALGGGGVIGRLGASIPPEGGAEGGGDLRHAGKALFQERVRPRQKRGFIRRVHRTVAQHILFQGVKPRI